MASPNTELQEASQALFCAVADYLGVEESKLAFDPIEYPTYDDFLARYKPSNGKNIALIIQDAYDNKLDVKNISLPKIEKFLRDYKVWYKSSCLIAIGVIKQVNTIRQTFTKIKQFKWQDLFYVRGDKAIMQQIEKLYNRCNLELKSNENKKDKPFKNINKWSPADIYFASKDAEKKIAAAIEDKEKYGNFIQLNKLISELIFDGDLLPLSLKKGTNNIKVEKINFSKKTDSERIAKYHYVNATEAKDPKDALNFIEVNIGDSSSTLLFRFSADYVRAAGQYKVAIKLGSAFGGSVGGKQLIKVVDKVDSKLAKDLSDIYTPGMERFNKEKKDIMKVRSAKTREVQLRGLIKDAVADPMNKTLMKYFKGTNKNKDLVIQELARYAGSASNLSAKYVVAK
jgi:hypothetical protein